MPKPDPRTIHRYSDAFKASVARLSQQIPVEPDSSGEPDPRRGETQGVRHHTGQPCRLRKKVGR